MENNEREEIGKIQSILKLENSTDRIKKNVETKAAVGFVLLLACFYYIRESGSIRENGSSYIVSFVAGGISVWLIGKLFEYIGIDVIVKYLDYDRMRTRLSEIGADDSVYKEQQLWKPVLVWVILSLLALGFAYVVKG